MEDEKYIYTQISDEHYTQVTCADGVRTTICENRFEIVVQPRSDIWEQQAVQALREWIRKRKEKLRESGDLSE